MSVTYIIIGLTVLLSMYAFNESSIIRRFIMNPYIIRTQRQYYRFVTSGFIHKDHMHLILNMVVLYFFGTTIEKYFIATFGIKGEFYFIALYLLAIFASDIPTYFKNNTNPGYNALGASGGVSAVIFASIILEPLQGICLYFICMPGFIFGTLYILFSYYQGRKGNDGINHDAHLYGALFGLFFCIILYPLSIAHFVEQLKQWRMFE